MTKSMDDITAQPRTKYSCSLMGDRRTGKTSLIEAYGRTVEDSNLLHMPEYTCVYVSDGAEKAELDVHDSPHQNDGRFPEMFSSQFADVIAMVFSVASKESFETVETVFMPFVRRNYPQIPVIIVANEVDLRYAAARDWLATPEMGHDLAQRVGADAYVECSSLHGHGVRILFEEAVQLAKNHRMEVRARKRKCVLV